ncbi:MAG TPA: class I SAM-dependent RNA methyltransferase [Xanthobacteraceae bacterium]|nr:class I SAM-dependent RNA methyltransferase [Xanthobacteraceae bacterium]
MSAGIVERLTITAMGHRGDGLAAGSAFVPYALPGEIVAAEGDGERLSLREVIAPSPDRVAPVCDHFGTCGGCALQHWRAEPYLAWKQEQVGAALRQAGIAADVAMTRDAHGAGRRRAVFHARHAAQGTIVGFSAARSHQIVPIDRCPILAPEMSGALPAARAIAEQLRNTPKPLDIHVTATDSGLDIDVRGSGKLKPADHTALASLAARHGIARLTRHGEIVTQQTPPMLTMGPARVPLPPAPFLQATAAGESTLADLVTRHCAGAKTVADLFCGIGPFALRLAEQARVFAADSEAPAITALRQAAAHTPGLKPLDAQARDLFRRPLMPLELKRFDAVVFDPPRQGAEAQARQLAASTVRKVVAVSCNPATFARDAAILVGGGYRLVEVTPVDQFRYSPHVEVVAAFSR